MAKRSILFTSKNNFGNLLLQKKFFIAQVYSLLAFQIGVIAITIYILRKNQILQEKLLQYFWIWFILVILTTLVLILMPLPLWSKIILFTILSGILGIINISASKKISTQIIEQAILSVLSIFIIMTIIAIVLVLFGINLSFLSFALMIALFALIIVSLLLIFFKVSSKIKKIFFTIGIVLFSIFIAFDTNVMLQPQYSGDIVDASISLFLDIINLFNDLIGYDMIDI